MKQLFVMLAMAILPVAVNAQEQAQKAEKATSKSCCKEGKKDGKSCCTEENKKDPKSCCNKEGKIWSLRMWGETHQNISDIDLVRRQWLLFCCCFLISTYFLK